MKKKFISVQGILEGIREENPNKPIELYVPLSYKEIKKLNNKKLYKLKIEILNNYIESTLKDLDEVIKLYKELYHHTEFYENEYCYKFNFADWNTIKKANGKLTRYYNDIKKILKAIKCEELNTDRIFGYNKWKEIKNENNHNSN